MFKVWHGGLSFHGGIICGGIATYLYFNRHGVPFLEVVDSFTPGVGLGIILVRIGNFMNGDILGYQWEGPWAMNFPHDVLHIGQPDAVILRHPTEIYGMLVGVVTLATVLLVWRSTYIRKTLVAGMPLMALIISYSLARSIIEDPFRNVPLVQVVDPATAGFGLFTYSQIASVVLILIALAYIPYLKKLQRQRETGKADGESRQVRRAKKRTSR
jgi:phosphatidylglycerol:prolipoprotein diacylglycerol transferase